MIIVMWGKENSELPLWIKSAASQHLYFSLTELHSIFFAKISDFKVQVWLVSCSYREQQCWNVFICGNNLHVNSDIDNTFE